jgi:hypothetical protein
MLAHFVTIISSLSTLALEVDYEFSTEHGSKPKYAAGCSYADRCCVAIQRDPALAVLIEIPGVDEDFEDAVTTKSNVLSYDSNRWSSSAVIGSKVYFAPDKGDHIAVVDLAGCTVKNPVYIQLPSWAGASPSGGSRFYSIAAVDTKLVLVPYSENAIVVYDTVSDSFSVHTDPIVGLGGGKWWGAVAIDGKAIFSPHDLDKVGVFDVATGELELIDASKNDFVGAAVVGGLAVFPPRHHGFVGIYDPSDDNPFRTLDESETDIDIPNIGNHFHHAVGICGKAFFAPYNHGKGVGVFTPGSPDNYCECNPDIAGNGYIFATQFGPDAGLFVHGTDQRFLFITAEGQTDCPADPESEPEESEQEPGEDSRECSGFLIEEIVPDAKCESFDPRQDQNGKVIFRAGCKYTLNSCSVLIQAAGLLDIEHGAELAIQPGSELENNGKTIIRGVLTNTGTIHNNNLIDVAATGALVTSGDLAIASTGAFRNQGIFTNSGTVNNEGIASEGTVDGVAYGISNSGKWVNEGTIGNLGTIKNTASFQNTGTINNERNTSPDI